MFAHMNDHAVAGHNFLAGAKGSVLQTADQLKGSTSTIALSDASPLTSYD